MPKTVTREQVQARLGDPGVVLVEALPPQNYEQEHLPGAINVPHDQVDELAPSLLPDKTAAVIV